jgi:hypothetical protein
MERFYNLLAVARATDSVERPARRDAGRRRISRQRPNSLGRTHARFTDFIVHFRMDWRSVCRGIDDSCWTVCGDNDGSFRPLLFGMEREPAAPAGSTFFTFTEYAAPFGWIKTTPPRNGTSIG